MILAAFYRVKNIVGNGENADYLHFLFLAEGVLSELLWSLTVRCCPSVRPQLAC